MIRFFPFAVAGLALASVAGAAQEAELVGIWNFKESEGDKVVNARPQGGGSPALLKDFDPETLGGTDVQTADFAVSRSGLRTTVKVARSGWATFRTIPDNGLLPGVHTPVGMRALAVYCDKPGNWVYFPGLASALVGRPGGSIRSFGIAAWYLLQTEGEKPRFVGRHGINCLFRLSQIDARLETFEAVDRFFTEDVGNGLAKNAFVLPPGRSEAAAARWVHVAVSGDGAKSKFQVWVNGEGVVYSGGPEGADGYPWPAPGGLEVTFRRDHESDGGVVGRWLGGYGASGRTMGLAAVVVVKGEPIDQARARYLHELGRRGVPFDGRWFSRRFDDSK